MVPLPQMYNFDFSTSISSMSPPIPFGLAHDQFLKRQGLHATGEKHRSWRTGSCEKLSFVAFRGTKAEVTGKLTRLLIETVATCKDLVTPDVEWWNISANPNLSQVLSINCRVNNEE